MTDKTTLPAAPLLLFDSGVGGLSVMAEVRALLPSAPIIYAADFAGLPYGEKTEAEISARVPALLGRLVERFRPSLVTIACNTASTIALPQVRGVLNLPVVGTVPAIKPAALLSKTRVIGVLGTAATVRQPYVDSLAQQFAADAVILRHGAGELVAAAEAKLRGETPDPAIFVRAIEGMTSQPHGQQIDTIVLACTHFPLVEEELANAFGRPVTFVHGGQGIARRIAVLTKDLVWADNSMEFVVNGDIASLAAYRPALDVLGFARFSQL